MNAYEPVIVGHRGAALVVEENTIASFKRALADGATVVECDVHLSKDGTPIVMHDETIDRMAAPTSPIATGAIAELSDASLATVELQGQHHVPLLSELLAIHDLELYVEVKVAEAARASAELMRDERPEKGAGDTVISFVPEALAVVREVAPWIQRGLLLDRIEDGSWDTIEELGCSWVSLNIEGITGADVEEARRRNLKINVWTVNEAEQAAKAAQLRVDSISTDDPAWLRGELQALLAE